MPHVKANGIDIFYEMTGPAGAPMVAFSHSIGATLEMWDEQVKAFAGRYRCLRFDTRGHGRSEVVDRPATIDDLADDLAGLLAALDIPRAHVVGLSLGGMLGQAFALRHPERLDRLVLIATTAHMNPQDWRDRIATVERAGYEPFVDAILGRWFSGEFAACHPEVIAAFRERFMANDKRGYISCCRAIERLDLEERIHAIAAPTLIIVGAEDPTTPIAMADDLRKRIPGSEMLVLPNLKHLLVAEMPEVVDPYIASFLDRGRTAAATPPKPATFADGLANRKAVLGVEHVERSLANAGEFATPYQDYITRVAWGEAWGDPTLPWKTRSMLTLAMMIALHREEEFKLHVRAALNNGVTPAELRAVGIHAAVYAGIPAANAGFRWMREVGGPALDSPAAATATEPPRG